MKVFKILPAVVFFLATLIISCNKKYETANLVTLQKLYRIYRNGEIDECKYDKKIYFVAGENVYDASAIIYDNDGNQIGSCNYAVNLVDTICTKLQDCVVIYRCKNHITGQPPVDKYNLNH